MSFAILSSCKIKIVTKINYSRKRKERKPAAGQLGGRAAKQHRGRGIKVW